MTPNGEESPSAAVITHVFVWLVWFCSIRLCWIWFSSLTLHPSLSLSQRFLISEVLRTHRQEQCSASSMWVLHFTDFCLHASPNLPYFLPFILFLRSYHLFPFQECLSAEKTWFKNVWSPNLVVLERFWACVRATFLISSDQQNRPDQVFKPPYGCGLPV